MSNNYDNRLADYVDVAERIRIFRERFPEGSLQPLNLDKPFDLITIDGKTIIVYIAAAYRWPEDPRPGIGIASELMTIQERAELDDLRDYIRGTDA